jgi:general secretion pathway protein J
MTLVEVLLAVTLVSLLSVGMLFAMRAGLTAMDSTNRRIAAGRRVAGAQRILEMQFSGFLPVVAKCGAAAGPGVDAAFFQGEPTVLRFVSTYSIAEGTRGTPQLLEYFVVPGPEEGVRLVVNERPYRGPVGAGLFCGPPAAVIPGQPPLPQFPPPVATPGSFVLADRLRAVRFSYLEFEPARPVDLWLPRWPRMDVWPKAVRIEMLPLDSNDARNPAVPFVGPIRVTRPPGEPYEY